VRSLGRVRAQAYPHTHERRQGARRGERRQARQEADAHAHQQREAIKRVNAKKETLGEIARSYNVSRSAISRLSN